MSAHLWSCVWEHGSPRVTCLFAWFMVDIPQPRRGCTMSNPWCSEAKPGEREAPTASNLGEVTP